MATQQAPKDQKPSGPPQMTFDHSQLPVSHLESLKYKTSQIIESIQALQRTIQQQDQPFMPPWPDILSKYNVILSQTHNLSNALVSPVPSASSSFSGSGHVGARRSAPIQNPYERIALHPRNNMTDTQLDNEVAPILRNQQTVDVLKQENETVKRLSECMKTRGSLGVLGVVQLPQQSAMQLGLGMGYTQKKPEYEDVLAECEQIKNDHDRRVERAVRAVTMLREKFDWKQRVEVQEEEPEELEWDPRLAATNATGETGAENGVGVVEVDAVMTDVGEAEDEEEGGGSSSDDDDEVEGALQINGHAGSQTPTSPTYPPAYNGGFMGGTGGL
ncbi:hypothetical protein AX16_004375 [Volvariella volvacea WC 439]|nr:hypothetical protein AX16_004375 [Volvariella volvacea WC 439]